MTEPIDDQIVPPEKKGNAKAGKRNHVVSMVILGFLLLGLLAVIVWWIYFRNYESTDDAYVGGDMVVVTSRQEGAVVAYYTDDTDYVEMGQLLVVLDPADFLVAFEQKRAALALASRQVRGLFEDVKQKRANVQFQEAAYYKALTDYKNRQALVDSEAISREDYTHSEADLQMATASLELAYHQQEAAEATLGQTKLAEHPLIIEAKEDLKEAYLRLKRCAILAPTSGYVAKRTVQVGQWVKTTLPLLSIIPLDNVWVDANYKETQLENIRIGQPVEVTADIYGSSIVFNGRVGGILPGSGSVFSLLPPQNASGNWIKIVQRVPVRIYLDEEEVRKNPLFLGISVFTRVNISDTSGPMLATVPIKRQIAQTTIFETPVDEIDAVINEIVIRNLDFIEEHE